MPGEIQAGSTVALKSGGPTMTVKRIEPVDNVPYAVCDWFAGNAVAHGSFPLTSLKLINV